MMSLDIQNDHKFTPEEIQYLKDRCEYDAIRINAQTTFDGKPSKDDVLQLDPDIYDFVVSLNLRQLQSELRKNDIKPEGDERQLRTMLAAYLQNERDDED